MSAVLAVAMHGGLLVLTLCLIIATSAVAARRARQHAKAAALAEARRIYGLHLSDEERAEWVRSRHGLICLTDPCLACEQEAR